MLAGIASHFIVALILLWLVGVVWGTIAIDEKTKQTSVPGVFAGGDVVTGAATAIEAIAAGVARQVTADTLADALMSGEWPARD